MEVQTDSDVVQEAIHEWEQELQQMTSPSMTSTNLSSCSSGAVLAPRVYELLVLLVASSARSPIQTERAITLQIDTIQY